MGGGAELGSAFRHRLFPDRGCCPINPSLLQLAEVVLVGELVVRRVVQRVSAVTLGPCLLSVDDLRKEVMELRGRQQDHN